jgi:hypothetical protein
MGAFAGRGNNPYNELRELALEQNAGSVQDLTIDEDEPYKVLVEFFVSDTRVTVFCAIDGTASVYLGSGAGFINGGNENETLRSIAKSVVFEAKNVVDAMEPYSEFPTAAKGSINVYVVTERCIYGITVDQQEAVDKTSEIWKIYYLAIEIISMYMNS